MNRNYLPSSIYLLHTLSLSLFFSLSASLSVSLSLSLSVYLFSVSLSLSLSLSLSISLSASLSVSLPLSLSLYLFSLSLSLYLSIYLSSTSAPFSVLFSCFLSSSLPLTLTRTPFLSTSFSLFIRKGFQPQCIAFEEQNGEILSIGFRNGDVKILNTETLQDLFTFCPSSDSILFLKFSSTGSFLAGYDTGNHTLLFKR